jgi:hypothetical protein
MSGRGFSYFAETSGLPLVYEVTVAYAVISWLLIQAALIL